MTAQKKYLFFIALFIVSLTAGFLTLPAQAALKSQYYDFGPYYQSSQVLGFSFSSLENLPAPKIPENLIPPPAQGLTPDNPFYPLERLVENVQLTITLDPAQKEKLRLNFASERLSEAKTLMERGKIEAATSAIDDYSQALNETNQTLSNLTARGSPQARTLATEIEQIAASQAVAARNLTLTLPPTQAQEWSLVAEAAGKALDSAAKTQGEAPIPEELSGSLQKLKEQGLLSEEESNKLYSLKDRGEVREELTKLSSSGQFPTAELTKLDTAIAENYPDIHKSLTANFQVAELRFYQTLPQPSDKVQKEIDKWRENSDAPPPNDIKPYLWYQRSQELAREVDLSNFQPPQQAEVAKLYPRAITDNPTYQPAPTSTPQPAAAGQTPSPTPSQSTSDSQTTEQTITPTLSQPTPTPPQAKPYLGEDGGMFPGDRTYFIKRWGENISLALTFDETEKARLRMQQAERRLTEAEALSSDPAKTSLYEGAIKEYKEAMSAASSHLKISKTDRKALRVAERLENQAARHEAVLEKGLLPPVKDTKLIPDAIKATEDAMDRSADIQGRPALPPALIDRVSDLKAQGLVLSEEAEDLVRSNSREEARGKIRKLVEQGTFPLADSKKMDESQALNSPSDYNQLTEVRKVEELQNLRAVQSDFAQTATLRANATNLSQKEATLKRSIDPTLIQPEDLGGRKDLLETYKMLVGTPRPINNGQFGQEATPGAKPVEIKPPKTDAVLTTCPAGAVFKQYEGCVWADNDKAINDYDQYRCVGPRQYYSFAARKCVAYDSSKGWNSEDAQPICPLGYIWNWQTQSCQTSGGGILPFPTPTDEPAPKDDKEREERSKACPEGASYKAPDGCVWDKDGKRVHDPSQYRCGRGGQYYSFEQQKCVSRPKEGEPYPKDSTPTCKDQTAHWSWSEGRCVIPPDPRPDQIYDIMIPKPSFATPDSPFYPLKQAGEAISLLTAFTPEAKQQVRINQAKERLAEGYAALEKGDNDDFKKVLSGYTAKMQEMFNDISKSSLSEKAKKAIGEKLAKEAVEQNLILQKIEVIATDDQASALSAVSSTVTLEVDKAAELKGEPPVPDEVKAKIEALPEQMISESEKKKILETDSRVEARLALGTLVAKGGLTQSDAAFLNKDFATVSDGAKWKLEELKRLEEISTVTEQKKELEEKVEKNEGIVKKLNEFQKNPETAKEIPADIRPYIRLTRIDEVAQTIRPDIVRLEDFQNRKDVILAVTTLQEEFRPTKEAIQKMEEFRRRNPSAALPPDLARVEALAFSLGVRGQAGPCYLPSPPFAPNTPCPAPGAPIPVASYTTTGPAYQGISSAPWYGGGATNQATNQAGNWGAPSIDKDGKPLIYGQGPKSATAGVCPDGYHWMYDSGGWCMSNSGNYSASSGSSPYTPSGPATPGYTPYSPYYTAPGAYPASSGYPVGDNSPNDGCPYGFDSDGRGNCIRNSYPSSSYSYGAPSYYGPATTSYTTNPPPGTVPGSGPKPTSPGQCPSGYHWMSDNNGWCMADSNTYVPGGTSYYPSGTATSETPPPGGYNCGSQPYDPATKKCRDGACPGGFNWDGSKCVASSYGGSYYSPNLTQSSCGPGYYWDGKGCIPTYSGSGSSSGTTPWCWAASPPPGGWSCGSGSYWDSSTCSCRPSGGTSSSGSGGGYSTSSSYQYGCTPGYYWDGSKCVAGSYSGAGWSDTAARSQSWCQPPSGGCGSNSYWDYGSCYCRSSSTYSGGGGPSPSNQCQGLSCGGGAWLDYSTCSCKYSGGSGTSSTGSTITCYPPSAGCPGGWYDYGTCSCKTSSTTSSGSYSSGWSPSPSGTCGYRTCGSNEWFDTGTCSCRPSSGSTTTSGGTSSGGSSSGSCPSGYHWMDNSWCMADGAQSPTTSGSSPTTTTTTTSTPPPSTSTTTSSPTTSSPPPSEPAPSTSTTTSSPTTSSPPPSEPAPAPQTESAPPPTQ